MKRPVRYTSAKDLRCSPAVLAKMRRISMLILDVDGVLTDGGIIMDDEGKESKCFSVRDGTGAVLWKRAGYKLAIISGRMTKVVEQRARQMHVDIVYQNSIKKLKAYNEIKKKYNLKDYEIAYIGDDLHDIPVMKRAGLSIAVADAVSEIVPFSHTMTKSCGGKGAAREVIEAILKAKGLWKKVTKVYYAILIFFSIIHFSCAKKEKVPGPVIKEKTNVQQAVDEVYLQETEEGKKRWELWANSVELFSEKKVLKNVRFKFYGDEDVMYLKGDETEIMNESGDIDIRGHVTGKSDRGLELATDRLLWQAREEILSTESPVKLMSESIYIAGVGLETTPKLKEAKLKNNVYVSFFENITDEVPMVITAASLMAYFGENTRAIFDTDVFVKDSRVEVRCARLIINFTPDGRRVEDSIAQGKVVIVSSDIEAECGEAHFLNKEKKIILTSDPIIWHEKVKCRGERIIYLEEEKKLLVENNIRGIFLPKTIDNIANKR